MSEIHFRVWHRPDRQMYYRGYQKLTHILLCGEDQGREDGRGIPLKRASFDDCDLMQGTGVLDRAGREIFEGDAVRVYFKKICFEGILESVPDMYRSRRLHPLHDLLTKFGVDGEAQDLEFEILGNRYETPEWKS